MGVRKRKGTKNLLLDFTVGGKRYRPTSGTPDKEQARLEEARLRLELAAQPAETVPGLTVQALVARFLAYQAELHPRSLKSYYQPMTLSFVRWAGADRAVSSLTLEEMQKFHAFRTGQRGPTTANRSIQCIKTMLALAVDWGLLPSNPARRVKKHRERRRRDRYLTLEEQARLLAACQEPLRRLVFVALGTGMRRGELLGLRPCDVDLNRGLVTLTDTKTDTPRYLSLLPDVKELFAVMAAEIPADGYFFRSSLGRVYTPDGARASFQRAVQRAGLNATFHDQRHTHASDLLAAKVEMPVIQKILGHASIRTTERYAQLRQERVQEAISALNGYRTAHTATQTPEATRIEPRNSVDVSGVEKENAFSS